VCLLLLIFLPLVSQEGIAKRIGIRLTDIDLQSSYEEVKAFLDDYSQYQLELMFWMVSFSGTIITMSGIFIFNSYLIDEVSLIGILENDNRVGAINRPYPPSFRPRQFALKLFDTVEEIEFINDYSEFGLVGSIARDEHHFGVANLRSFGFNDTTIYTGCFYNILRNDSRVEAVFYDYVWIDGEYGISLHEDVDHVSFFSDYPFVLYQHNSTNFYSARLCFITNNEFEVLELLIDDNRVCDASLTEFRFMIMAGWFPPQQPPSVETKDETMRPFANLIVYPNPVNNSNVTIQTISDSGFGKSSSGSEISIYNVKGQLVSTSTITNDVFVWDRKDMYNNDVPSGIYFVRVTNDDKTQTRKLLVIR
jgi:hypothetical protein